MPRQFFKPTFINVRSLKFRLTLWNTVVVLIVVIMVLLAAREGLRYYLILETDSTLDAEVRELLLAVEAFYPDQNQIIAEMERKAEGHRERGWHIRWLSEGRRETIWASALAPPQPTQIFVGESSGHVIWASDNIRSIERQLNRPGLPAYFIRVGTPLEFINADVDRLTRVFAQVSFVILLLAPLGGLFMAKQAVEPLQQIIRTTERLRPTHLDERLRVRGVGDELDQLAIKINAFLDQIGEHLEKKREFVANAAHELRSPLAAIQSVVDVTLEKRRSIEEYEELLYQVNDECRHLGQLVNQLLMLAQSASGEAELRRERVPLRELIDRTIEMFEPVADERGVTLRTDVTDAVAAIGDSGQLRQLLTNLVDNAIKFTPQGGTVSLTCQRANDQYPSLPDSKQAARDNDFSASNGRETRQVVLRVADTGMGIPAESIPLIFDRFYQVDKARQRGDDSRGNGLGLSICLSIVQSHRGAIAVESTLGKGTIFTVRLPEFVES